MVFDIQRFALIAITVLGLSALWVLGINKDLYLSTFSSIQKMPITFNWIGVIIAFGALILGAYFTTGVGSNIQLPLINTIFPGLSGKVFNGRLMATTALFGIAYLFWNGLALAIFNDYSLRLAITDSIWGIVLGAIVGYIAQM